MNKKNLLHDELLDFSGLGAQIMRWSEALAQFSDDADALTVIYCSPSHVQAAQQLQDWMTECGFDEVSLDAVGNVIGRYRGHDPCAPQLLTGSHYDTVRDGGKYDGRLGILLPMAAVQCLSAAKQRLPFDLVVIGFTDEEGIRFQTSFLGSKAITGDFDMAVLERLDDAGVSMREAMQTVGLQVESIDAAKFDAGRTLGYVECHIEQGPVLLERELALGVVTAINGSVRMQIDLQGRSGHSGTTPMMMRRDALCAAAQFVLAVEKRCASVADLVGTVGFLQVPNGSINVVPGRCSLSLDVRAPNDDMRNAALRDLLAELDDICQQREIDSQIEETMRVPATATDENLRALMSQAVSAVAQQPFELASGAGHDAMQFAAFCPISMLFVRCGNGGISHSPLETMTLDDAHLSGQAFVEFIDRVGQSWPAAPNGEATTNETTTGERR